MEKLTEEKEEYSVVDAAFNPEVLQTTEKDKEEKENLCLLALNFIQQQHNLTLSQHYKLTNDKIKGSFRDMKQRLMSTKTCKSTLNGSQSEPAPSLLQQICSLQNTESDEDSSIELSIEQERKPARSGLIEVISSTELDQPQPQLPKHQLTICPDGNGSSRILQLCVELPGVRSVSQCQLRISEDDILLEVEDIYYLLLPFPELVKEETCTAKFNKKKQTLNVTEKHRWRRWSWSWKKWSPRSARWW
nr:PIH1 domain-containing protein 2 isoform X4 [Danio rerio]|eukprot:XP_021337078.1 PIH1 domain-containing protein 2 isoform X4 [Danio rerio]